ncbi:MAG TPA: VWA domain-containing protein, partial [Methylomirabilota bacterium]|nr:VWA domain-containing protein [Methylomirabilota bacterium]
MTPASEPAGRLGENIMHFARTLRAAGLPVGPGKVLDAIRAVETVGLGNREDFYWALHATLVNRREQQEIFDQAFHIFWRNPRLLERMMAMLLPQMRVGEQPQDQAEMSRRLAEALGRDGGGDSAGEEEPEELVEVDAALTYSDRELLQAMDFEKMSADEIAKAKRLIAGMRLPIMDLPTRRYRPDRLGARIDMRATLRAALRSSDS